MWLQRSLLPLSFVTRTAFRMRVDGAERVPSRGPVLVVANHASFLDPLFIASAFPRRPLRFLVDREWYTRSFGWRVGLDSFGCIPVSEEAEQTIDLVVAALRDEAVVCVFPEGTISLDGRLNRFRRGVAWMAARSGAPVVPCAVHGAFAVLPRHRRIMRPGRVHLSVAPPCRLMNEAPTATQSRAFVDELERAVAAMLVERVGPTTARR